MSFVNAYRQERRALEKISTYLAPAGLGARNFSPAGSCTVKKRRFACDRALRREADQPRQNAGNELPGTARYNQSRSAQHGARSLEWSKTSRTAALCAMFTEEPRCLVQFLAA